MGGADDAAIDIDTGGMDVVVFVVDVLNSGLRCAGFKRSKEISVASHSQWQ